MNDPFLLAINFQSMSIFRGSLGRVRATLADFYFTLILSCIFTQMINRNCLSKHISIKYFHTTRRGQKVSLAHIKRRPLLYLYKVKFYFFHKQKFLLLHAKKIKTNFGGKNLMNNLSHQKTHLGAKFICDGESSLNSR